MRGLILTTLIITALILLVRELSKLLRKQAVPVPGQTPDAQLLKRPGKGGSPSDPVVVESASVIEAHAVGQDCAACASPVSVEDHRAERRGERRLRVVEVKCRHCARRQLLYFTIRTSAG